MIKFPSDRDASFVTRAQASGQPLTVEPPVFKVNYTRRHTVANEFAINGLSGVGDSRGDPRCRRGLLFMLPRVLSLVLLVHAERKPARSRRIAFSLCAFHPARRAFSICVKVSRALRDLLSLNCDDRTVAGLTL